MGKKGQVKIAFIIFVMLALFMSVTACGNQNAGNSEFDGSDTNQTVTNVLKVSDLQGDIKIDGSNTIFPISDAITKEFNKSFPNIKVHIGVAGTSSGFRKFIRGKLDICNASSPMDETQVQDCKDQGIEYIELKIAYDGVVVVVNKDNNWVDSITTDELNKIWASDSTAKSWKDVNPKWADTEMKLYAPDSVAEFFSEAINGDIADIRPDYTQSENGKALLDNIVADKNSMGIISYGYYSENSDKIKALGINAGAGEVKPDGNAIKSLTYKPLSRTLYMYVNKKSLENEGVKKYLEYFLGDGSKLIKGDGGLPLNDYNTELAKIK